MATSLSEEVEALRRQIADLTQRVWQLEQAMQLRQPSIPPHVPGQPAAEVPARIAEQQVAPPYPVRPPVPPAPVSRVGVTGMESLIGSQWLNRIGIVAVLMGVSYFLKYAFENNWIGPAGRIGIGLLAGIALIVWSESFRKKDYLVFSYSLKAVGIGTIYLSLWAAFHVYQLISGGRAFLAMIVVTAASAILAITEDAQVLAAFALAGGFATPALLSSGQNKELQLFSYITLLDVATVIFATFKPWQRLLMGSFFGTMAYYVVWYDRFYGEAELVLTWTFATIFFAIFATAPIIRRLHSELPQAPGLLNIFIAVALLNAATYFLQTYALLDSKHHAWIAWMAVMLGALYLLFGQVLRSEQSPLIFWLHVAIAVGFLTIAIPLKLNNHWITIGWFVESAVLLFVAKKGESQFLKYASVIALVLGVFRLIFIDNYRPTTPVFNMRFATYLVAVTVLALIVYYWRERQIPVELLSPGEKQGLGFAVIAINVLLLMALSYEVRDYFYPHRPTTMDWQAARAVELACSFSYSALWMLYGAGLMIIGFWKRMAFLRWQALTLIALTIAKVFLFDVQQLERVYRVLSFILLGALLLAISFAYQRNWLQLSRASEKSSGSGKA